MTSPTTTTEPRRPGDRTGRKIPRVTKQDVALIEGLLLGMTVQAAAERAGMSESTAYRRRRDPVWQRKMMEAEAEAVKSVIRRGVRTAEASIGVLARIAGNVKGEDGVGAAEKPEARTQVYAARALLSAFVGIHGRGAMANDDELADLLGKPQVDWVLVGVDTAALT